ncbi:MAG: DEAD/DEAH box helicase [Euryarchaeota archaeon]|nr:DEAD/DEAH box helicase [Euryarchaeota archaeon]MDE1835108.1 DEAD/DEAH box helicase [Euryarchaeota archaeon]MDE1880706.1 DEAD/DEAH box helicase [Euryarchaeota archaeon]MDE2044929.1 DEAD/DEAH box helicase [Thermoplasmata archaeon]
MERLRAPGKKAGAASSDAPVGPPSPVAPKPQRTLDDFLVGGGEEGEQPSGHPSVGVPAAALPPPEPPLPEGMLLQESSSEFVDHPLLRPSRVRAYPFQLTITRMALETDVLVVLPTGLGKTVIAAMAAAERLRCRRGKVLFLAPTRPLVEQHARSFAGWFRSLPRATFTGTVGSPKREGAWEPAQAVFATPQLVVNDLVEGRYSLRDVALLVFDEAHRAVGNYAYVKIAAIYRTQRPEDRRVLGLTASPGGKGTKIDEVLGALAISRVEARTREDPDVAAYVQAVETEHVRVRLPPELEELRKGLREAANESMHSLQKMGFLRNKPLRVTGVKDLVATRGMIMARPGPMGRKFGALYRLMLAMHFYHAGELLETQGVAPLLGYFERVAAKDKLGKADKAFLAHPMIAKSREAASVSLGPEGRASHPKLPELASVVQETLEKNSAAKILVFAQFRDTVRSIVEGLAERGVVARRFVGQATRSDEDKGMDQREQARVLEDFRSGRFPVLVASSVAEEGIDIPNVDLVVFFEALPSEIRTIQRKGRTGRSAPGRVVILMTQGTRDEGYHRAERKRESAMLRHVRRFSADGKVSSGDATVEASPGVPPAGASSQQRRKTKPEA